MPGRSRIFWIIDEYVFKVWMNGSLVFSVHFVMSWMDGEGKQEGRRKGGWALFS